LEFDVEEEVGSGWDVTRETTVTIGVITGDVQCSLLAKLHGGDTLIPSLDDLANSNGCDESTAAIRRIKLRALVVRLGGILQVASVLNGDLVADPGDGSIALLENGLGDTHDC